MVNLLAQLILQNITHKMRWRPVNNEFEENGKKATWYYNDIDSFSQKEWGNHKASVITGICHDIVFL
jgi:hypothetical protein